MHMCPAWRGLRCVRSRAMSQAGWLARSGPHQMLAAAGVAWCTTQLQLAAGAVLHCVAGGPGALWPCL